MIRFADLQNVYQKLKWLRSLNLAHQQLRSLRKFHTLYNESDLSLSCVLLRSSHREHLRGTRTFYHQSLFQSLSSQKIVFTPTNLLQRRFIKSIPKYFLDFKTRRHLSVHNHSFSIILCKKLSPCLSMADIKPRSMVQAYISTSTPTSKPRNVCTTKSAAFSSRTKASSLPLPCTPGIPTSSQSGSFWTRITAPFRENKWEFLALIGYLLVTAQWSASEILFVRILSVCACLTFILYTITAFQRINYIPIFFNCIIVSINLFHIGKIYYESRDVQDFTEEQKLLYKRGAFEMFGVSQYSFKKIITIAERKTAKEGQLYFTGDQKDAASNMRPPLILILSGRLAVLDKSEIENDEDDETFSALSSSSSLAYSESESECDSIPTSASLPADDSDKESCTSTCSETRNKTKKKEKILKFKPGEFFGEVSLLRSHRGKHIFEPNAVFTQDSVYLEWRLEEMERLLMANPELACSLRSLWNTRLAQKVKRYMERQQTRRHLKPLKKRTENQE